jgi:hypothetical protein
MIIRAEVPSGLVATMCLAVIGCLCCCGEAKAGIDYTCDPTIDADDAGSCPLLNTVLAGICERTFTNANANIYITDGNTGELSKQGVIR